MPDVLSSTSREIERRLAELRPVIAEYERLQAAAAALAGIDRAPATRRRGPGRPKARKARMATTSAAAKAAAAKPARTAARKTTKRRGRRKGTGGRPAQALELVKGQPGITIPELANKMGISPNYLYRVLPGLQKERKIRKHGKGWQPA